MPTYEYVCKSCGHLFEIVQSMRDDPLRECPECGGELRKVFAPPAISFKGSGFYATDHGKKAAKPSGDRSEQGAKPGKGDAKGAGDGSKTTAAPKGGPSSGASSSSGSSSSGGSSEGGGS
jgi:putative FmdB family regulatory protein